jgi:L-fucose/D-arabinose isomerase
VGDRAVLATLDAHARAGAAVRGLRGITFGRIGGRPMGMNTAVSSTDQWIREFGIDVEEIDQFELVRQAGLVERKRIAEGRKWLERHSAGVHYDGTALTPEVLERQIAAYHGMQNLIDTRKLDFCGIKAQPELTDHFCTMDIAEAFLNDPYDWEGPKRSVVCSTEADMDAALTMQIMARLSDTPVLFADVRHYHSDLDIWDLCNSGQHATWFAARSEDPAENMSRVHLYPEDFYFPAGGACVHHLAAPGEMTFARLSRLDGGYRMQVLRGGFERFDDETNERLMNASTYVWPHAFARLQAPASEILGRFGSNHIHAIPGDHAAALRNVCQQLEIVYDGFGSAA